MSAEQAAQVFDFAQFLRTKPRQSLHADGRLDHEDWLKEDPSLERKALMETHDLRWDVQFAKTDEARLDALVAVADADIANGKTTPMFDENGEFIEP